MNSRRRLTLSWLAMAFYLVLASNVSRADLIMDGDFELNASAGHWTIFNRAFQDEPSPGIDASVEGTQTLRLEGDDPTQVNFNGVFQDVALSPTLNTGHVVSLSGIAALSDSDPVLGDSTAYLEISFVDLSGVEFGLTPSPSLSSSTPGDEYVNLATGPVVIPAGATAVRFKAVFRHDGPNGSGNTNSGSVWFDNLSTTAVVPEPTSSVLLIGLGVLAYSRRRRVFV